MTNPQSLPSSAGFARPSPAQGSGLPRPISRAGIRGNIARQVLISQFALIAVVIAGPPTTLPGVLAATAATLVVGGVLLRIRDRHPYSKFARFIRFRERVRRARRIARTLRQQASERGSTTAPDPLAMLIPDVGIGTHADREGNRVGLVGDAECWSAVLHVTLPRSQGPTAPVAALSAPTDVPSHVSVGVAPHQLGGAATRVAGAQAGPANSAGGPFGGQAPAGSGATKTSRAGHPTVASPSDRRSAGMSAPPPTNPLIELLGRVGLATTDPQFGSIRTQVISEATPASQPPSQRTWLVALRLTADPSGVADTGGADAARRAASSAALLLAAQLSDAGFVTRPLDGEEVRTRLALSLGIDPVRQDISYPPAVEHWHAWSIGALHSACYRLRRTPRSWRELASAMTPPAAAPALMLRVAVLFDRPTPQGLPSQVITRIAVPARPNIFRVLTAFARARARLGRGWARTDGEHVAGVRATLPLGIALDD